MLRLTRALLPLLLLLLQLPLALIPGYLSHDDLEWLARADVPWSAIAWVPWLDVSSLQYRPLTFNLWLVLAHLFGGSPRLMHTLFVLIGTANAWLLARVIIGMLVSDRVAYVCAVVFALSPYAVYVHGWTGTLADLLTLLCGLIAARCLQRAASAASPDATVLNAAAATSLAAIALLCKESAVVLPALLTFILLRSRLRKPSIAALAIAALITVGYVAMRPALAESAQIDPAYAWSLRHVPARLAEYALYPFMPPLFEIGPLLAKSTPRIAAAVVCLTLLLAALGSAGWRWPACWLLAFTIALGPVLLLPVAYDHYAYLAAAPAVAVCASAWTLLGRFARCAILALAAIVVLHGFAVMPRLYAVGVVQRNLCDDLVAELRNSTAPLHIAAADPRDAWLIGRLLRGVEGYRGVAFGTRVRFGGEEAAASGDRLLWMNRGGHLQASAPPLTPD